MSRSTKTCSLSSITVSAAAGSAVSIDCTCCGTELHHADASTIDFTEVNEIAVAHVYDKLFQRRTRQQAPATFKPAPVQWIRNQGSDVSHAYAPGPGMGDSPLCGRGTFRGIEMYADGTSCSFCLKLAATFKG